MNLRQQTLLTATVGLTVCLGTSAPAATVTNGVAWPTAPAAETVDVNSLANTSGRFIKDTRQIRQTFQTDQDIALTGIVLSFDNYSTNLEFTIKFFEVSDIEADTWSAGNQVGSTITVNTGPDTPGATNMLISLTAGEQFTLAQRNSGVEGYGVELESVGTADTGSWLHAFDGTDYAPGRYYKEDGTGQALANDMGIALVPEPASGAMALVGLGVLAMRRRRG